MAQKYLLFDLDGTLLPVDTDQFIQAYMKKVAQFVGDIFPPEQMVRYIWQGTEAMIRNTDPQKSNEQVFTEHFLQVSGLKKEEIWPVFDQFYREVFPGLVDHVQPTPHAREIITAAHHRGYQTVIATNPLFPQEAVLERMKWAGVDDLPHVLVTTYENSHFCKPQPGYYQEICARLQVDPEHCIMIGNDMQEDMIASAIGMQTYWVTDFAIDRGKPVYPVTARGTLEQLSVELKEGKGLFS